MERNVWCLEGIIGCGKTTVLNNCPHGFARVRENLPAWRELDYPRLAYTDRQEHSWNFQSLVLATQQHDFAQALEAQASTIVVERSVVSNAIFAELLHEDGVISDLQMQIYRQQHKAATLAMKLLCDKFDYTVQHIWLDVSPDECLKRLNIRNKAQNDKDGESAVDVTYLERLYLKHKNVFSKSSTELGKVIHMKDNTVQEVLQRMVFTTLQ